MNFQDIPTHILTVRVKQTGGPVAPLREQAVFSVEVAQSRPDEFEVRLENALVFVRPVAAIDARHLGAELASGQAMLAQLANPAVDDSIELQIAFFTGERLEMGDIEIGVDEYVQSRMAEIEGHGPKPGGEDLYRKLDELCRFRQGNDAFFFFFTGPAIGGELEAKNLNSFCIAGDGIRFVATETALPGGKSIFMGKSLTKSKSAPDRALRLGKGNLRFVDWTQAGGIRILAREQMRRFIQGDGSYLKKWDEFGDLEGELLLGRAREVGALQFSDMTQKSDGTVAVRITQASDSALKALARGDVQAVRIVDELPNYLKNEETTYSDFSDELGQMQSDGRSGAKNSFNVSAFDGDSMRLTLDTETLPIKSGTLVLSLAGEIAQIGRRKDARQAIVEGRAANPQLGLLIEENGKIAPPRKPQKVPPLTAFVRNKVFRNPPTVMQEKAIEAALNTPDIALIQGPPGTGKTTVIAAILERLNEMADKRGARAKGQILLTGFQHNAVENMIERISLNGIPVPKFGKRSGADDESGAFEEILEKWCKERADDLRRQNPQLAEIEREAEIENLCLQYVQAPSRALALQLAENIASLGISALGEDVARRAANLAKNLAREEKLNDDANPWLVAVRRLRIDPESFADDGAERAADALDDLRKDALEESEAALLDKASLWRGEDGPPPFLKELAKLKRELLRRFAAPPVFRVEKQNDEVVALAEIAIECIKTAGYSAKDQKFAALAEFLAELENDPYGMIDAVSEYSFAFAATCQQSVNWEMRKQKKGATGDNNGNRDDMEYEYVIVDEAARVSPRDLMVPMAQGKRIVLVGDHRQLPHIVDEEVARQMEAGETAPEESVWLEKSMFEYLFSTRLKTLEESDGIARRVTLDRQYRMHPLLGEFISRNFYERFAPEEKFTSGRPAADFIHDLPDTGGKPAAWLDVPAEKGKHERRGTSWTRPAEATAIARRLQEWMDSEAGKDLTFGAISFYKAQAELIGEQLGKIADGRKLRVGTVDSFQGMEFDVVFLSMVRTSQPSRKPDDADRERQARRLFGHLCLYNRLNVSMSRQKKLLVVAGDSGLLQNRLAEEFIPGLVDFHKLCREKGVVLPC
jgi:superfamily I DNA/RNA helicase